MLLSVERNRIMRLSLEKALCKSESPDDMFFNFVDRVAKDPELNYMLKQITSLNSSGYCSSNYSSINGMHLNGASTQSFNGKESWKPTETRLSSDLHIFKHSSNPCISDTSSIFPSLFESVNLNSRTFDFNRHKLIEALEKRRFVNRYLAELGQWSKLREEFSATYYTDLRDRLDGIHRNQSFRDDGNFGTIEETRTGAKLSIPLNVVYIDLEKVDEAIDKNDGKKFGKIQSNDYRTDFIMRPFKSKYKEKAYEDPTDTNASGQFKFKLYGERGQTILFLHRNEEIFALTDVESGIDVWADKSFPFSVASAILDNKSVTEKEVKTPYENQYSTAIHMRNGTRLNETTDFHQRYAPKLCTKFNGKTSNAKLNRILGRSPNSKMEIQVRLGSISFSHATGGVRECSEFCDHLAAINRNLDLLRSNEFDDNCNIVSKIDRRHLDNLMRSLLLRFLQSTPSSENDDQFSELRQFQISVDDSADSFNSRVYAVYDGDNELEAYRQAPTVADWRSLYCRTNTTKLIDDFEITKKSSSGELRRKMFDCLEGTLYDDSTKKHYWRKGGEWYEISSNRNIEIFMQYHKILRESLISSKDSFLVKWPLNPKRQFPIEGEMTPKQFKNQIKTYKQKRYVEERIYNQSFDSEASFVVIDSIIIQDGIEICDLFQHICNPSDGSKIYLYFVKKVFGADGYRSVISQMTTSASLLFDDLKLKCNDNNSSVYKLYQFIKDKLTGSNKFCDYKEFCDRLKNAVFVLCPLFDSGKRRLDDDNPLHTRYDYDDIANEIHPSSRDRVKPFLHSFFLNNKYIYPSGELTPKWIETCAIPKHKGFLVRKPVSGSKREKFIFDDSYSENEISEDLLVILKRKYYKKVEGVGTKDLLVELSHHLNSMRFGFKICQIEGVEDDLCP